MWSEPLAPIAESLRSAGVVATLLRVDFKAALDAALERDRFDLVIVDPRIGELSAQVVEACCKAHGRKLPILVIEEASAIGEQVLRVLDQRLN
jgi:hypothetical protein